MLAVGGRLVALLVGILALVATTFVVAAPANAAKMNYCWIAPSYGDTHARFKHGDVFASVEYDWIERTFFGQVNGVKYFGMTSWDKVGTRPYWINGC